MAILAGPASFFLIQYAQGTLTDERFYVVKEVYIVKTFLSCKIHTSHSSPKSIL
jgi:hypothetical protein